MRFLGDDKHNLMLPVGAVFTESPGGDWQSEMVPALVDAQGVTVTMELEQAEFAALLNGGKLQLKIIGVTLPTFAIRVSKP